MKANFDMSTHAEANRAIIATLFLLGQQPNQYEKTDTYRRVLG
jgi:hypothetical protein